MRSRLMVSLFVVVGVLVMASSAKVECAFGSCKYGIEGAGIGYANNYNGDMGPVPTNETMGSYSGASGQAYSKAYADTVEDCNAAGCAQHCGGTAEDYNYSATTWSGGQIGYSGGWFEANQVSGIVMWSLQGQCSCMWGGGEGGEPYSVPGVPVRLTTAQRILSVFGLFPKPKAAPKRPGGGS